MDLPLIKVTLSSVPTFESIHSAVNSPATTFRAPLWRPNFALNNYEKKAKTYPESDSSGQPKAAELSYEGHLFPKQLSQSSFQ
jgi:hypothetical protein